MFFKKVVFSPCFSAPSFSVASHKLSSAWMSLWWTQGRFAQRCLTLFADAMASVTATPARRKLWAGCCNGRKGRVGRCHALIWPALILASVTWPWGWHASMGLVNLSVDAVPWSVGSTMPRLSLKASSHASWRAPQRASMRNCSNLVRPFFALKSSTQCVVAMVPPTATPAKRCTSAGSRLGQLAPAEQGSRCQDAPTHGHATTMLLRMTTMGHVFSHPWIAQCPWAEGACTHQHQIMTPAPCSTMVHVFSPSRSFVLRMWTVT